jgi:xylan 1,4-beta-xylosidase
LWQWRVTQNITYSTGNQGLLLNASRENEDLGTLLVQPMTSPDYEVSAIIDLGHTGPESAGGVALVGAANNRFGGPVAAVGISASKDKIAVWQTVDKETQNLAETNWDDTEGNVQVKMRVTDGHLLTFSVLKGGAWQVITEKFDASPRVPWGMGFRFGLVAKGPETEQVNFKRFDLVNY